MIVGASVAGVRRARTLRDEWYDGRLRLLDAEAAPSSMNSGSGPTSRNCGQSRFHRHQRGMIRAKSSRATRPAPETDRAAEGSDVGGDVCGRTLHTDLAPDALERAIAGSAGAASTANSAA